MLKKICLVALFAFSVQSANLSASCEGIKNRFGQLSDKQKFSGTLAFFALGLDVFQFLIVGSMEGPSYTSGQPFNPSCSSNESLQMVTFPYYCQSSTVCSQTDCNDQDLDNVQGWNYQSFPVCSSSDTPVQIASLQPLNGQDLQACTPSAPTCSGNQSLVILNSGASCVGNHCVTNPTRNVALCVDNTTSVRVSDLTTDLEANKAHLNNLVISTSVFGTGILATAGYWTYLFLKPAGRFHDLTSLEELK
jgi:hypothetical protein